MANQRTEHETDDAGADAREQNFRKYFDDYTPDSSMNAKLREDPGLLPLTEDPRERRLKRTTM
jgi:hypothetical protein